MIQKEPPDVKCPAMAGTETTAKWCQENQHLAFCGNCKHQNKPAREISFYQLEKSKSNCKKE